MIFTREIAIVVVDLFGHKRRSLRSTAPGGLVLECSPGVQEVVSSILSRVIPKTLKMVLNASLLSALHSKNRSRTYGRFPIVDCKMRLGGMLYQCSCGITFRCGSTISATCRHRHDVIEIMLKVTLN